MSDVFVWRILFLVALIAASLVAGGLWRSMLWLGRRMRASDARIARSVGNEASTAPVRA